MSKDADLHRQIYNIDLKEEQYNTCTKMILGDGERPKRPEIDIPYIDQRAVERGTLLRFLFGMHPY